MRNYKAKDVDSYIASSPEEARPTLEELRKIIKSTIPEAEEGISWGVPFYKYHGLLGGFAVFKNHVDFGLAFVLKSNDRGKLLKKGYNRFAKTPDFSPGDVGEAKVKDSAEYEMRSGLSLKYRKTVDSKSAKAYKTGKKTIQIKFGQRVPATEVKQILKDKAKMNEAKKSA